MTTQVTRMSNTSTFNSSWSCERGQWGKDEYILRVAAGLFCMYSQAAGDRMVVAIFICSATSARVACRWSQNELQVERIVGKIGRSDAWYGISYESDSVCIK
jgi:hypothetical protein